MSWQKSCSSYWLPMTVATWLGGIMFSSRRSGICRFFAFIGLIVLAWVTFIAWPILKEDLIESEESEK
jgi:hypothetical protein